jgi:hypothetical protein
LLQALHCWIWPNIFFWSILPGHNIRQAFPLFPAIGGLAAMVWITWLRAPTLVPRLSPLRAMVIMLGLWLVVKLAFVHIVVPGRDHGRQARAKGEQIAARVPEGSTLYLFRLKDEGILFYYGRPARRLAGPDQLPSSTTPLYCILDSTEWQALEWPRTQLLLRLDDEQGAPIFLVKRAADQAPNVAALPGR